MYLGRSDRGKSKRGSFYQFMAVVGLFNLQWSQMIFVEWLSLEFKSLTINPIAKYFPRFCSKHFVVKLRSLKSYHLFKNILEQSQVPFFFKFLKWRVITIVFLEGVYKNHKSQCIHWPVMSLLVVNVKKEMESPQNKVELSDRSV